MEYFDLFMAHSKPCALRSPVTKTFYCVIIRPSARVNRIVSIFMH